MARAHSWTGWGEPGTYVYLDTRPIAAADIPPEPSESKERILRDREEYRLRDFCQRLLGELRQRGLTS